MQQLLSANQSVPTRIMEHLESQDEQRADKKAEAHNLFLDEIEVSMLLQAHADAKREITRSEAQKKATSKLKAKHGESLGTAAEACDHSIIVLQLIVWLGLSCSRSHTCTLLTRFSVLLAVQQPADTYTPVLLNSAGNSQEHHRLPYGSAAFWVPC